LYVNASIKERKINKLKLFRKQYPNNNQQTGTSL
jgi:hypothetical protein